MYECCTNCGVYQDCPMREAGREDECGDVWREVVGEDGTYITIEVRHDDE
jgi:hypothetical protein